MSARATASESPQDGAIIRGILTGLVPAALLAALGALTVLATTLARAQTTGEAFLAQQPVLLYTFGAGVLVAFVAWIAGCRWALRRARAWERSGAWRLAAATLWTLGASAIIVLLPVILAVVIPQHPAHPAPLR